ncbi:class I SAM-dependent methyltransferase [Rhabdothermincola sediminis]|uniref:class I SAM-dependent methyltransferase n=1 Tax=Rhabdothermincola sediminis TaxID=2751370 RepID=UPI001AA09A0E|nr:class I SAM-dependent methyltransferase [Rhabdothermincola sediminis]
MKRPRSTIARTTLARYRHAPAGDRFHVQVRWLTCPIDELERRVPRAGRILDLGCGHGLVSLYLAACAPGREVTGVDIDEHKIELARRAAAASPATSAVFAVSPDGSLPTGEWDAIVITDVLYLLGPEARAELLRRCAAALAPGGLLLVKETDTRPRWKHRLAAFQEVLATKVLRITAGSALDFASSTELGEVLRAAGLEVEVERLDRGYLHPHVLLTGRRPRIPPPDPVPSPNCS